MAPLKVEVVYALPGAEDVAAVSLVPPASAAQALAASGLIERHPELAARPPVLGIFGVLVRADTLVADGDRVEIYRPLALDPKEARRRRAYNAALRKRKKQCG